MNNNNPYSGTILENTYNPVVFGSATDNPAAQIEAGSKKAATSAAISAAVTAAAVTLPLSLPAVLVTSIATGSALYFKSQKSKDIVRSLQAADTLVEIAACLTTFDLWEAIVKKKALKEMSEKYQAFVNQTEKDFVFYKDDHEASLQKSIAAVEGINRSKVVMKDYLLQELCDQLKRSGLNGSFEEPKIERLDLRAWPINEAYHLNVTSNKKFIDASGAYLPLFVEGLGPITNRIRIRKIRNALKQLQPVAELNLEQMLSDLLKLDLFSAALTNIDTIYKEVLDKLRPIMKTILKDLEDKYQGDVRRLPKNQADALYTIKSLFKDLAEITIVPHSDDTQDIYTDVCQYSNTLSERYNRIRETIYNNFCN